MASVHQISCIKAIVAPIKTRWRHEGERVGRWGVVRVDPIRVIVIWSGLGQAVNDFPDEVSEDRKRDGSSCVGSDATEHAPAVLGDGGSKLIEAHACNRRRISHNFNRGGCVDVASQG